MNVNGGCAAALLYGAACCAAGACVSCREVERRMRAWGFTDAAVAASMVGTWYSLVERCPVCGWPPPPALEAFESLPTLDRSHLVKSGSHRCRSCDRRLTKGQRHFCDEDCRMQWRRAVEGWGETSASAAPRRAARMGRAE